LLPGPLPPTQVINDFARRVIRNRRRDVLSAAGSHLGPDLLSRFLDDAAKKEARDAEGEEGGAEEARTGGSDKELRDVEPPLTLSHRCICTGASLQELRDIVLNFMIAGPSRDPKEFFWCRTMHRA
jgi:hypothetical protein